MAADRGVGTDRMAPRPLIGVAAMLGTIVVIPLMGLCVKFLDAYEIGAMEIMAVRSLLVLLLLLPALALAANVDALRRAHKPAHLWHAAFGLSSMACFYVALAHLPLITVTAINFTTPMFVVLLAIPLLGERPDRLDWLAIAVGFAGALIVLRPSAAAFNVFALVILVGSFLAACMLIVLRLMPAASSNFAVLFFYAAMGSVACGPLLAAVDGEAAVARLRAAEVWPLLVGLSLLAFAVQLLLTLAFRLASSVAVGGLDYLRLFWAGLLGWLFFAEVPDGWDVAGMALIMASGLVILVRQSRHKPNAAAPPC